MSSALVGWIVSLVFVLILVGGFFVGFWRGFRRSTANLIFSVIGVIVAFFVTPIITRAILGIQVDYDGSKVALQNIIYEMLVSIGDVRQMVSTNANLAVLFKNLPSAIFSTIIFIFVTIAIEFVIYLIYKIFNFAFIKGPKGGRLFGGLVGVAKAFIVTIIAFMPLAGLIGLANNLTDSNDYNIQTVAVAETQAEEGNDKSKKSTGLIIDKVPETAIIVVRGLENNFLTKCSSLFGLDNAMFDYYSSVKVDGGKVKIRKEIENFYDVADFGYQITKYEADKINYEDINYDKLLDAVKQLTSSDLYKHVISTTISDIITDYQKYSFLGPNFAYSDILADISQGLSKTENKATYFRDDVLNLINSVKTLGQAGIINDIFALEKKSIDAVANVLTNDSNIESFEKGINGILKLNVIQDSVSNVMQKLVDKISTDVDNIGINSSDMSENDWKEVARSFTQIVKDFGSISSSVDVVNVIEDATILLDKEKNYDIANITSKLGDLIDEIRANKLLQTAEGKPIFDKLLEKHDISLPTEEVVTNEGEKVKINNYKELFEFISPSLVKVRDEEIYQIVNGEGEENIIISLAKKISQQGKHDLLSDILMPLYQIDFTRELVIEELIIATGNDFVELGTLNNYSEWKSDLGYISDMLIALNNLNIDETTYLEFAINGDFNAIINNIDSEEIDKIFIPALSAKSTNKVKQNIFDSLKVELDRISNKDNNLSIEGVSFTGEESQTQEICNILKKLIVVNNSLSEGQDIKDADKAMLSSLLEEMKKNAYRTSLLGKSEEGIFHDTFENFVEALKASYADVITQIENSQELLAELGVDNLNVENFINIDYSKLLDMISEFIG